MEERYVFRNGITSAVCLIAVFFAGLIAIALPVAAQDEIAISQGYSTSEKDIPTGALVSLVQGEQRSVELSNMERAERLVGVTGKKPLIELSNGLSQVQAVISGTTPALVSDINGDIRAGDKITASPINGVGMKTTSNAQVVGIAQADFSTVERSDKTITDKSGNQKTVKVGQIPVQINVTYYVVAENQSFLPSFLQSIANSVAGKPVSPYRALASVLVLLLGFVSIATLLYSSVRSSIISIGRNPLSEKAVNKSLITIVLTALGILLVMLIAVYLILTV